jgi:hypothetical protein
MRHSDSFEGGNECCVLSSGNLHLAGAVDGLCCAKGLIVCVTSDARLLKGSLVLISSSSLHLNTVGPVFIRELSKTRAFETRFQVSYSVCKCVAMISAASASNMS